MGMIIQNGKIFSGDVILKGATIDTLWSGTGSTVGGTVALSNPYTDYDLLVFKCQNANGSMYDSSTWETKSIALSTQLQISNLTVSNTARRTIISFTNSTTITLTNLDGNNYLKEVIGIKLNGGVADYHEYSTSEKVVGKWIDGSTVYEKTLKIEPVALSNGSTIAHGISNLGIVVSSDMVMHRSNGEFVLPYTSNYDKTSNFIITSTDLTFVSSDTWGASDYINLYVTLRYTKTT